MKGIGMSLLGIGLFLTAAGVSTIGYTAAQQLSGGNAQAIRDLSHISNAKTQAGEFFYNYYPTAAGYSVHEASEELGSSGGGVSWSKSSLKNYAAIYTNIQDRAASKLNSDYSSSRSGPCSANNPDYGITLWSQPDRDLKGVVYTSSELKVTCGFFGSRVTVKGVRSNYHAFFNATDNRYLVLANETIAFFKTLRNNWNSADVEDSYSGSASACGTYPYSGARSSAEDKFRNDLESGFEDARSKHPKEDGVKEKSASFSVDYSITEESTSKGGCCSEKCVNSRIVTKDDGTTESVCTDYECTAKTKSVDTTIEPDKATASVTYKDSKFQVPLPGGWEHLEFSVDSYTHPFE